MISTPQPVQHPAQRDRHFRRSFFALIFLLLICAIAYGLWPRKPVPLAPALVPVAAGRPIAQDFPIRVVAVGNVQALNTVDVKVRVDGQLQRVAFHEGQDVSAGQLLAQLDQGPLKAQLDQAIAAQQKDQASLANARLDLARYTKLVGIGAATSQSVDTAKAQVGVYEATVAADAALVHSDRLQLSFTTLTAPFAGRVGQREADVGAIVHPGDVAGLVTLTQMEPITVLFSVPQDVLPELVSQQALTPLPVHVGTARNDQALADGTLVFVDSLVDTGTGQIKARASFTNRDRRLWPGQLVNVRVLLRTDKNQLAVPSRAIVNTQDGTQLYVLDDKGAASLRAVHTGVSVDGMTQIINGIGAADLVVFDGQSRLNPGSRAKASVIPATPLAPGESDQAAPSTDVSAPA